MLTQAVFLSNRDGGAYTPPLPTLIGGWATLSRKQILQILAPPIAFHRCLVPIAGSVNAALMLSQAIYWTPRTRDPEGWFYKSQKDWEEETGLSRSEQELARKQLRTSGFWQERLRGVPATLYFCVDCEILQTRLLNFNILVCSKPANLIADSSKLSQRLPDTNTETTQNPFGEFWDLYPRKVGKEQATRLWTAMSDDQRVRAIYGLKLWKQAEQWHRDDGKFVPFASTFLRQRRWEDEPWMGAFDGSRHQ